MSRPRGNHAARRDEIARAGGRVIAARGLGQVTLRDVAAALGVTTGVLTHYFPSKEALLRHTKDLVFDEAYARARAAASGPPGLARVEAVVISLLPLDRAGRLRWRLLVAFLGGAVGSVALRRSHTRRMERWYALFAEVVTPLAAAGVLPPSADPRRIAAALALFVEGVAIHAVVTAPEPSAAWQRALAREQVRRLVGGQGP